MIPFYSKRNQVYPVMWQGRVAVEKHFTSSEDWRREVELYTVLTGKLPMPEVLDSRPGFIAMEYQPYATMLDLLERQERGLCAGTLGDVSSVVEALPSAVWTTAQRG